MGFGTSISGQTETRSAMLQKQQEAARENLEANQNQVEQNKTNVGANTQAQQGNAENVVTNNGNISQTNTDIATTTGNINTVEQQIGANKTQQSGVNAEISNLNAQLAQVQDDPERATAIQGQIDANEITLSELEGMEQELNANKQDLTAQRTQQENTLTGYQNTGVVLEQEGTAIATEAESLQQEGVELAQAGTELEGEISELDTQIEEAEAEEVAQSEEIADVWDENQKKIEELGDKLVEEGTAVVVKSFKPGTTVQDVAEQSVAEYFGTMLNSDMFTDEDKQAFRNNLAATLQNPKSLKALERGDLETVMKDPTVQALINERKTQIETLNLNNKDFQNGKIDVPVTSGEQDLDEMKEQYTAFMFGLMRAADGNTAYYKAGLENNSGEVDMWAPTLRGFNKEIVSDLESANQGMHQSMRDVILDQDADKFVNYLIKVNGKNFHVSTSDLAQLFKDYNENPHDPTINARIVKYCGYEASANRLNNDINSANFAKNVGSLIIDTGLMLAPGVGEIAGAGIKGGTKLISGTAKCAKYSSKLTKVGKWSSRIGRGADYAHDAYDLFTKFRNIYNSGNK